MLYILIQDTIELEYGELITSKIIKFLHIKQHDRPKNVCVFPLKSNFKCKYEDKLNYEQNPVYIITIEVVIN